LNSDAMDFILAAKGLDNAHARFEEDDNPYSIVECAWWIGAAALSCGRKDEDSILGAFYWVRNKGFHETAMALGQIQPSSYSGPLGGSPLLPGASPSGLQLGRRPFPSRWLPLDGDDNQGGRAKYGAYLANRAVIDTIREARVTLLQVFEQMRNDSGVDSLD